MNWSEVGCVEVRYCQRGYELVRGGLCIGKILMNVD